MKCTRYFLIIIFLFLHLIGAAQLCQGSLGDPVVKITFGSGPNPGPPLGAGITNFIYQSTDCPDDGLYSIRNATTNCFIGTWQNVTSDHTGDPNGYFMLVNASQQPSDFFVDTIRGLCPGTVFEFSAWILNILKPSACNGVGQKPNITFSIEKPDQTVLATYNTGDINPSGFAAAWQQYGFFFTMPVNLTDVVVRMKNNAPGGCGNDLALDDIAFRPCGPSIQVALNGSNDNFKNLCAGDNYNLTLNSIISSGYNNPLYQWQQSKDDGITWTDILAATSSSYTTAVPNNLAAGTYKYRVAVTENANAANSTCKVYSNFFSLIVNSYPIINIISNSPVCEGDSIELQGPSGNVCQWTGPGGFTFTGYDMFIPYATLANQGMYYITATSFAGGCSKNDSSYVTIIPKVKAYATGDTTICEGKSTMLQGSGGGNYVWKPTTGLSNPLIATPLASPIVTTTYTLFLSNNGCTDTASVLIQVLQKPIANAGPDKQIFEGNQVQLNGSASGSNIHYYWTPNANIDNDTTILPMVSPPKNTIYTLNVVSDVGCGIATDEVLVGVYLKLVIPNAFSPNNDGINDVWNIANLNTYPYATVNIFDRYGRIVFESYGYAKPWDGTLNGKPVPVGTYYYIIDTKTILPKLNGSVFLIR
jgi:gliding motility-associated-like protein